MADPQALERFKVIAYRALRDFTEGADLTAHEWWDAHRLDLDAFPVPDLVLFGLSRLRGLKAIGRGEKIAWTIDAMFKQTPFQVGLRKRGFELLIPRESSAEVRDQIIAMLHKSARLAASFLKDAAAQQIEAANVTIDNRYSVFEGAYRFFREQAQSRFETAQEGFAAMFDPKVREGGYFAGAMINAYFSRLEHVLVLALAFTDFDPTNGALRRFSESLWDDKFAIAFDLTNNAPAKRARDILGRVKKDHRNPTSHGGFDKKGTAFHFHVAGISAVPAILLDYEISIERFVSEITRDQFRAVCGDLDECDRLLKETHLGFGLRYAEYCLPISFSAPSRAHYREATLRPDLFEEFLEAQQTRADMSINMDW